MHGTNTIGRSQGKSVAERIAAGLAQMNATPDEAKFAVQLGEQLLGVATHASGICASLGASDGRSIDRDRLARCALYVATSLVGDEAAVRTSTDAFQVLAIVSSRRCPCVRCRLRRGLSVLAFWRPATP